MGPETFPGACQITVHGKGEDGEKPEDVLVRELPEELGENAAAFIAHQMEKLTEINRDVQAEKTVISYAMEVDPKFLTLIRLNPSTGGLRLLAQSRVGEIRNLRDFCKTEGIKDRSITAMFPDEIEAVKKAFARFASPA